MTLRQDIDLLQRPPVSLADELLRVEICLGLLVVIVVFTVLASSYLHYRQQRVTHQITALQATEMTTTETLTQWQERLDPSKFLRDREEQISATQLQLLVLANMDRYRTGFSKRLQALAQISQSGLWLKDIRLDNSANLGVHLQGLCLDTRLLPDYIAHLRSAHELPARQVYHLQVKRTAEGNPSFALDSVGGT
ncbi:MAG: hypothetical protein HKM02_01195 [Pseudomonadales bacterium]|nr:hypothetical protein [Pseudomonadales bacterium]